MEIKQEVVSKIFDATQNENEWKAVLRYLIELSGSIAAAITLRDQSTCQVIVDNSFEIEFHSPFIEGLDCHMIADYITNLREKDTWAESQIINRPFKPLLMSNVHPNDQLERSDFGHWVLSQGFNDTVAYRIGGSSRYWTSLNLYFHNSGEGEQEKVLSVVETYAEILTHAWSIGRDVVRRREMESGIFNLISELGLACCLVSSDGKIKDSNEEFQNLVEIDLLRVIGPNRRLSFTIHARLSEEAKPSLKNFPRHYSEPKYVDNELTVFAKKYPVDPRYKETKDDEIIIFFERSGLIAQKHPSQGRINLLGSQEKLLYDYVLGGRTIEEAGKMIGLKRARTFEIWRSVKDKIGFQNSHNVRQF